MSIKNIVFSVILAIFFTWFALANSQPVTLSVLIWKYTASLSLIILLSILIGIIITGLLSVAEESKLLKKIKELEGKLKHDEELLSPKEEKK
jgi:uncharacterized integral membrane protein